ncbi:tetrahydromethanopterin S-methyltransferase subunit G [Fusobacterium sp. PH5-7]|uniref:hypothetical protein n=1 Tax=Fusobacterium sp. PH5-7 TaxID=2940528 RepID=UPI0024739116|nr:hypothetical protein [Fusobacterium sp. PH5-7]MDH6458232.1 tetrahydromethanopterin S-methyltransferase subunit G [Fusobacterium sp. PH5-7]
MEKNKREQGESYRLFGCRFKENDFKYINRKLDKLKKEKDISNSEILLELFKIYNEKNIEKDKEESYRLFGCYFKEKDFKYINGKLKQLKAKMKMSNGEILLELFKTYNEKIKIEK